MIWYVYPDKGSVKRPNSCGMGGQGALNNSSKLEGQVSHAVAAFGFEISKVISSDFVFIHFFL